jgi:thioredoxin 1
MSKFLKMQFLSLLLIPLLCSPAAFSAATIPPLPDAYKVNNTQAKVTLLEFSAPWCVTCQMLKPSVKKLTQESGKALNLVELNIDDDKNKSIIKRYGIIATPTFVLFNAKGQGLQRLESEVSASELKSSVSKALGRKTKS